MTANKAIYAVAAAVFAGLALIAVTSTNTIPLNIDPETEAFAQVVGLRQNIISVTGTSAKYVQPDQVVISFGTETQALTAVEASEKNAEVMNSVVDAVKTLGISEDDISTARFNVYPNYDTTGRIITGYTVSNIITVKTEMLEKGGQIIDAAMDAGANRVESVYFTLSEKLDKNVKDELISGAVEDAKMKAERALEPLGKKIIGVKSISLSEFGIPPPIPFEAKMADAGGAVPTPIFRSEQQVSTSVSVIFLID
jgi:hypothetical protein